MHRYGFSWLRRALPMLALALVGALLLTIEEGSADAACAEPPGALASAVNGDASGIVLTWEAPAGCAPDSYAVYRRTISEDGSRLAKIATVDGAALTYTDQNVTAGATYRYRVRSNDQGPRSGWTQIVMTEPEPEPAPSTNSAPTFDDGDSATRSVPENSAAGTSVDLAVAATDSDTDDTLTYSLSGTDAASFSINSSTGQLQTKAGVTYDYETRNSYSGTVNVGDGKDAAGEADTAIDDSIDVAITLTDVADAACAEPPGASGQRGQRRRLGHRAHLGGPGRLRPGQLRGLPQDHQRGRQPIGQDRHRGRRGPHLHRPERDRRSDLPLPRPLQRPGPPVRVDPDRHDRAGAGAGAR